jgi:hypothetical protein
MTHAAAPGAAENVPDPHGKHTVAPPAEYRPEVHLAQLAKLSPPVKAV